MLLNISSCNDDGISDISLGGEKENCDVLLGDFTINPASRSTDTVGEFSEIVFKNELGEEKIFTIGDTEFLNEDASFIEGDTTIYCYNIESYTTKLRTEEGIELDMVTEAKPYYPDVESKYNADVLKVFYNDTRNTKIERRLVFRKVLDLKDYPAPLYTSTATTDEMFFIDNTYTNVEVTEFNTPIIRLYYNAILGIIAFEDEQSMLWELKEKR